MPTWNSSEYLRFANERTQPSHDLAGRVRLPSPQRIIDLGCGPGNSTQVVAQRWPSAEVMGLDSSRSMLDAARHEHPRLTWIESDITTWAANAGKERARFDLIFSNAALQWVPGHRELIPALFAVVAANGALAFQVPNTTEASHQIRMRELANAPTWRNRFLKLPATWNAENPEFYYDLLAPAATNIELWLTEYVHVLDGVRSVVEWYRGTGLRPFLEALPDEPSRSAFLAEYEAAITPDFPVRSDGRVLMYFRRLFVIAYR